MHSRFRFFLLKTGSTSQGGQLGQLTMTGGPVTPVGNMHPGHGGPGNSSASSSKSRDRKRKSMASEAAAAAMAGLPPGVNVSQMTRDERRALGLSLPISVADIINLPMDEFNDLLSKHELTEEQLTLCRDIRRRGKNKAIRNFFLCKISDF